LTDSDILDRIRLNTAQIHSINKELSNDNYTYTDYEKSEFILQKENINREIKILERMI